MNVFEQSLDKLKQQQQLLAILLFAFIAVIIWIMISLFTSQHRTEISDELLKLSKPLTPSINEDVINQVRSKGIYRNEELIDFPIYMITKNYDNQESIVEIDYQEPSPTPNPSPSPTSDSDLEASSSAENASKSATTSN